jgi:hypothetical protein
MVTNSDVDNSKLLHGKHGGHVDAPTETDVDALVKRASDVGDTATDIARRLAELADQGVRPVRDPKAPKRQPWWARFKRRIGL